MSCVFRFWAVAVSVSLDPELWLGRREVNGKRREKWEDEEEDTHQCVIWVLLVFHLTCTSPFPFPFD